MGFKIKKDSDIRFERRISRNDALYRGLSESNAREVQKDMKRKGRKTHSVKNAYGTYDIYETD